MDVMFLIQFIFVILPAGGALLWLLYSWTTKDHYRSWLEFMFWMGSSMLVFAVIWSELMIAWPDEISDEFLPQAASYAAGLIGMYTFLYLVLWLRFRLEDSKQRFRIVGLHLLIGQAAYFGVFRPIIHLLLE